MVGHVPNLADKRTESEEDMAALRAFPGTGVPRKRAGLRGLVALNIDFKDAIARLPEPSQFVESAEEKPLLLDAIDARNDNDEAGMQRLSRLACIWMCGAAVLAPPASSTPRARSEFTPWPQAPAAISPRLPSAIRRTRSRATARSGRPTPQVP